MGSSSTAPYKRWKKKFLQNGRTGYYKKRNFALISKMFRSLEFGKREKIFTEKLTFYELRKFCKKAFFGEKIFGNFLTQVFHTFLKSEQFLRLLISLRPISKKFFSTLIRTVIFLEVKRSKKMKTVIRYILKTLF